jgi:pimeloyl-ACP methyl ester carboxylesterase
MNNLAGLDYDERGAGEVVFLVHAGVFGSWFAPLFDQPALDRFRVIRPIRPGHGRSPAPSEPASIAAHAHRCGELLRGLGVTRAHWVGHSSSCCIGLQLALDDPGLVASLTLFEPAKPSGKQREVAASTYVGPALAAAAQGDVSRAFDVFLRGVGGDRYREVLRARFGDDGLVEAEPRVGLLLRRRAAGGGRLDLRAGRGGPGRDTGAAALRSRIPPLVPRERRDPDRDAARCAHANPARAGSPRPAHPPRGARLHHRRIRQPPGNHALLTSSAR